MISTRTPLAAATALALLAAAGCQQSADPSPTANGVAVTPSPDGGEPLVAPPADAAVVIASVSGVQVGGEPVDVALQTEAQWGTDEATYRARVPADAASVALRFDGVVPARYGVVAVQPNTPTRSPARDGEEPEIPAAAPPLPSLEPGGRGGGAASGGDARERPEWTAAAVTVGVEGATVPLTLKRR